MNAKRPYRYVLCRKCGQPTMGFTIVKVSTDPVEYEHQNPQVCAAAKMAQIKRAKEKESAQ